MKIATVIIAALISAPAFAWGDREQGALAGAAGVLLLQHINRAHQAPPPPPPPQYYAPAPQPQYYAPAPSREVNIYPRQRICRNQTIYDHHGRSIGFERICW